MRWNLEVVPLGVSDLDRAKRFYAEQVGFDLDLDLVKFRPTHEGLDPPPGDRQMHDGTVANVGPPARQAVLKVAVALQVRAPRQAPEGRGDGS